MKMLHWNKKKEKRLHDPKHLSKDQMDEKRRTGERAQRGTGEHGVHSPFTQCHQVPHAMSMPL